MVAIKTVQMTTPEGSSEEDYVRAIRRQQAYADLLADNADKAGGGKVYTPGLGLAKVGSKVLAGMWGRQADEREKAEEAEAGRLGGDVLSRLYDGGDELAGSSAPAASVPSERALPSFAQGSGAGDAAGMLRKFEGYRDTPYWDVNAYRVGYGSDTITDPQTGAVRRVTRGDRVTRDMAEADLARRAREEQAEIARSVPTFATLPGSTQAALTSVAYNYGQLPKSVVAAAQSGDPRAIARSIQALSGHNGGINAKRRAEEAAVAAGGVSGSAGTNTLAGGEGGSTGRISREQFQQLYANPRTRSLAVSILNQQLTERAQLAAEQRAARAEAAKPRELAPGATLVQNGQAIYRAPEKSDVKSPAAHQQDLERAAAGRANTTTNIGGGSDAKIFDSTEKSAEGARAAAQGIVALRQARAALNAGVITGANADARLGLQKIGAFLGVADPAVIQNTETFRSAIAPQVAAMLKQTVGSANISNSDRQFAEKAAGGSIELDEGSIRRLIDIMEKANTAVLEVHRRRLDAIYPDGQNFARERALFGVETPPPEEAPPPPAAAPAPKRYRARNDQGIELESDDGQTWTPVRRP